MENTHGREDLKKIMKVIVMLKEVILSFTQDI